MKIIPEPRRLAAVAVLFAALLVCATAAFLGGRVVNGLRQAEAQTTNEPTVFPQPADGQESTPVAGEPWYKPYLDEERRAPVFDGELNGLRIGPSVNPSAPCRPAEVRAASADVSEGTPLEISPQNLPPNSTLYESASSICDQQVVVAYREYSIAQDPDGAKFGGRLLIVRRLGDQDVPLQQAATRASATTVLDRPAVAFRPLTPEGWGPSALAIAEPWGTTTLQATGLSEGELHRIAEGLYR